MTFIFGMIVGVVIWEIAARPFIVDQIEKLDDQ